MQIPAASRYGARSAAASWLGVASSGAGAPPPAVVTDALARFGIAGASGRYLIEGGGASGKSWILRAFVAELAPPPSIRYSPDAPAMPKRASVSCATRRGMGTGRPDVSASRETSPNAPSSYNTT